MAEHARFQKLVAEAKKHIAEISPQDAVAKLKSGEAVIVDVRDKDEWGRRTYSRRDAHESQHA